MIRSLLKLAALLVAGILIYNYLFGTNEEKENSRRVFGQLRGVVVSVADLVKSEKNKFDAGKYDAALDQLGGAYRAIREQAQHVDGKVLERLGELEERKAHLEEKLHNVEAGDEAAAAPVPKKNGKNDPKAEQQKAAKVADQLRRKEMLLQELDQLVRDSDALLQSAQQ
jgi:hypothetical protein